MIDTADKIKGIEIAISADTSGVTSGLKEITDESIKAGQNLKTVERLLKLDPNNPKLVAEQQKLLAESIEKTTQKLNTLQAAEHDVQQAFERGEISEEQYLAFQGEIVRTEARLRSLESQADETGEALDEGGEKASRFGDALKNGLVIGAKAAAVAVTAVATAAVALGKEVIDGFGELEQNLGGSEAVFGEYAEHIQKAGEDAYKNLGTSQSNYLAFANKMGALLQGSGFSVQESVGMTEQAMQRAADMASVMGIDTSAAFEAVAGAAKGNFTMMDNLGVAINDTTLKNYALEKGLGDLETTQDKVSAAMQLFLEKTEQYDGNFAREATETISGSFGLLEASWESLIAGFGNGSADIENLINNVVDALNAVIKNVTPVVQQMLKSLPTAVKAASSALNAILPQLIPDLIDAIMEAVPLLFEVAGTILSALVDGFVQNLPMLLDAAMQMILMLATGLGEALPTLIPTIINIVVQIVDYLISNIDLLVDAAISLMVGLADGLISAVPILVEKAPIILEKLVSAIVENLPRLLVAADGILNKIQEGIDNKLSELKTSAENIINNIIDGIKGFFTNVYNAGAEIVTQVGNGIKSVANQAISWGKDLIQGIIDGIKAKIGELKAAVLDVAETITSYLHFSVPDVGPLAEYESWMPDFMKGLASGIERNKQIVTDAVHSLANDMTLSPQISATSGGGAVGTGGTVTQIIIINLSANISNDMDIRDTAEKIGQELQSQTTSNAALQGAWA